MSDQDMISRGAAKAADGRNLLVNETAIAAIAALPAVMQPAPNCWPCHYAGSCADHPDAPTVPQADGSNMQKMQIAPQADIGFPISQPAPPSLQKVQTTAETPNGAEPVQKLHKSEATDPALAEALLQAADLPEGVEIWMVRDAFTGMARCDGLTTFQQINAKIAARVFGALAALKGGAL